MAIITCYECGDRVSDRAAACPHCGAPMRSVQRQSTPRRKKKAGGAGTVYKIVTCILAIIPTGVALGWAILGNSDWMTIAPVALFFWALFGLTCVSSFFNHR